MTVYIVEGSTGDYDDYTSRPVKGFLSESKAKDWVLFAQERADELFKKYPKTRWEALNKNQFDPNMSMDYTGTFYSYYPIEVEE